MFAEAQDDHGGSAACRDLDLRNSTRYFKEAIWCLRNLNKKGRWA